MDCATPQRSTATICSRGRSRSTLALGFRPADPNVPVGEPLSAAHGVDPSQPQTLLDVPPVEVIEAVRQVWNQNKKLVDVQVILDISGSMEAEGRLEQAKTALRDFIGPLSDGD